MVTNWERCPEDATFVLPQALPPTVGSQRVALHSLFRLVCEANQLMVTDVVNEYSLEILNKERVVGSNLVQYLRLADADSPQSHRLVLFLERTTGLKNLSSCTLAAISSLSNISPILTRKYRSWCSHCYSQDVAKGLPPYDRLLWTIALVRYCPVHQVALESTCSVCGKSCLQEPRRHDLSGFCPHCQAWLGRPVGTISSSLSASDKYEIWCSTGFEDLLNTAPESAVDGRAAIVKAVQVLVDHHHGGVMAQFARKIRRNKSVVASWTNSSVTPRWDALCAISFVYKVPFSAITNGGVLDQSVEDETEVLPDAIVERDLVRRRKPAAPDVDGVVAFMSEVREGKHPGITSVAAIARKVGLHKRQLYLFAGGEARNTSAELAKQAASRRTQAKAKQSLERDAEILRIAADLAKSDAKVTRRSVESEFRNRGVNVPWPEWKGVFEQVRSHTAKLLAAK